MLKVIYECDPELNEKCDKFGCHLNGGPCFGTKNPLYAKADEKGNVVVLDLYDDQNVKEE